MNLRIRNLSMILLAVTLVAPAFAQSGADTYKAKSATCHGPDGLASSPAGKAMKVPSFKAAELVKASDAELIAATKSGKGKMPAYNGKLTDAQIKEAIAYIRTLQKK